MLFDYYQTTKKLVKKIAGGRISFINANTRKIARSGTRARMIGTKTEQRPERPDVVLAVRFINEFTRLNHRLKNVYEVTVRSI